MTSRIVRFAIGVCALGLALSALGACAASARPVGSVTGGPGPSEVSRAAESLALRVGGLAAASAATVSVEASVSPTPGAERKTPLFSASRAQAHVNALAGLGPRREGSSAEYKGMTYIREQLYRVGYTTTVQSVSLPGGKSSHNLIAVKPGDSSHRIVLGSHMDSKYPSPGANDNASGCAVLLELARVLRHRRTIPTVDFVFFGAEEMSDSNPDHHHYGSRSYVKHLSTSEKRAITGMISVDMVGYGSRIVARSMLRGPRTLTNDLRGFAGTRDLSMRFVKDTGRYGWSDHEPFELVGIPSVWIEWQSDPVYHTSRDRASHVQSARLGTTGALLERYLLSLGVPDLRAIRP